MKLLSLDEGAERTAQLVKCMPCRPELKFLVPKSAHIKNRVWQCVFVNSSTVRLGTERRQRQANFHKFEVSLVYKESSRTARIIIH